MDFDHDNVRLRVVNEDRLSTLPDELIHKILSFIDTKYAVQRCMLSSRWKHLWNSVPCLSFNSRDFNPSSKSAKFVTDVLSKRNNQVEVSLVKLYFYGAGQVLMRKLASYAFSHNVQGLIIISSPKNGRGFPPCLFSSRTLKRFAFTTTNTSHCFTPKTPWDFPALTCLNLSDITLGDITRGPEEVFSVCVNLKDLTLKRFIVVTTTVFDINTPRLSSLVLIEGRGSGVNNVIAPQLENLTVICCSIESFNATPRLSSLYYKDYYIPPLWFKDRFQSLNKVTLSLSLYSSRMPYKEEDARNAINMLQDLHSAKFLTLNLDIVECISSFPDLVSPHPSPFRNLICLIIDSGTREYYKVKMSMEARNFLLENSPNATFTMDLLKEEPTKAMKAKEAREKKKAKLVEDIHSHMTELQSLLKQENTLVERKQSMENKKKIVENLMAGLQHVLTTNKLTLLIFFTAALTLLTTMVNPQATPTCKPTDHGPVVPTTPLVIFLETIQQTALKTFGPKHFDPKVYVDLSLKFDLPKVKQGFTDLPRAANGSVSVSDFNGFLEKFMNGVHEDLVYIEPVDFVVEPEGFLKKVVNENVREWGLEVHSLWKNLSRKVSNRVLENPELFTLLPLKYPVIIPGSRFQEVYYWDSYWVIRGLLVSKMYETAKGIVFNLIDLIDTYGYVLNGARAYYTNRSQPPLLSSMVIEVYKRTKDIELVKKALPALIKEHKFWNSGIHNVIIEDAQGARHNLSRYYAMWNQPRPESFTIDTETADKLTNDREKEQLYRELATTAETGWDFSTRWMRDTSDLTTLSTTMIVPVDLNAFVLKMELDIAFLANVVGESHHVTHFDRASKARKKAMDSVFWNEEKGQWFDYWLNNSSKSMDVYKFDASYQNQDIFASNFIPLWVQSFNSDETVVKKVTQSLQSSGLVRAAGIATSLTNSSQQWDFPNGWAPVQHMIVEGLVRSGSKEARSLAKDIAIRWIRTNYVTYKTSKAMHEKYDVSKCGEFGGGGEYVPQTGFGWSNGVALAFLEEFGWAEDLSPYCQ